jgi:hypothetical protein
MDLVVCVAAVGRPGRVMIAKYDTSEQHMWLSRLTCLIKRRI